MLRRPFSKSTHFKRAQFNVRVLGPSLLCTVQLDKVGELEQPHRGKCFDVRSGQLAEEIYDLRTNGASSLWSTWCLLSYQEELNRAQTQTTTDL